MHMASSFHPAILRISCIHLRVLLEAAKLVWTTPRVTQSILYSAYRQLMYQPSENKAGSWPRGLGIEIKWQVLGQYQRHPYTVSFDTSIDKAGLIQLGRLHNIGICRPHPTAH